MKVLQINATYKLGSTGKIVSDLEDTMNTYGIENYVLCGYSHIKKENVYIVNNPLNLKQNGVFNILRMRLTGINGYRNCLQTRKAIKWIQKIKPDIVHIHNIHGDWINFHLIFQYLIKKDIKIIWTFHDCWPFTGRCSHFDLCRCEKWKTECKKCTNKNVYPITYFFDFSNKMFKKKKNIFTAINKMIIVTPSEWLASFVKESFFSKYPVKIIHNGIDTSVYSNKNNGVSELIPEEIKKKKIILGVANSWSYLKGLDDFIALNEIIDKNKYVIILVGLSEIQLKKIPNSIIGFKRTNNESELAELYSNSYVFLNLTYQDNYPTTNLESQSCGTVAITYNTGGSPESIVDKKCVFKKGDFKGIYNFIDSVDLKTISLLSNECMDKHFAFKQYIDLYKTFGN